MQPLTSHVRYSVQILLPRAVRIESEVLHARLCAWRGDIELLSERLLFAIPTADLPLLVHIFPASLDAYAASLCDALTWSPEWRWADLEGRCPASLVVALTAQRPINHASMLLSFLAVLDTVLFTLPDYDREAAILHWIPAQQLLTFARYRELRTELGPCGPAVNVRIANATGRPGELLADTVGMGELGLPDLQTVFKRADPNDVMELMRAMVRTMFVGDPLQLPWVEETALFPPQRDALTLKLEDSAR
ncbi:MAG TPA: DUF4261 domain-containing protein [Kofleriaceae bacterium]|nr:DUF4261 domain-containing protein [Kofleriaceae bacterium]